MNRSARALPILGLPLLYGTVFGFGLVALPPLSILYLNSNTAFLGSIVVGNGINSGIILLARVLEERRNGASLPLAIDRGLSGTWKATLAASAAAAAFRASNSGRLERIGGRLVKLWVGGGEVVAHSRV